MKIEYATRPGIGDADVTLNGRAMWLRTGLALLEQREALDDEAFEAWVKDELMPISTEARGLLMETAESAIEHVTDGLVRLLWRDASFAMGEETMEEKETI